jgi:hypothetical protein
VNTSKLNELIEQIRHCENQNKTQNKLQSLGATLQQIVNQPQSPEHQNALAENLRQFRAAMNSFHDGFSPRDYERLLELASEAFSSELPDEIAKLIEENPMSPNVVREKVNELHSERNTVLSNLNQLGDALTFFDFSYDQPEEGTAEVGFQIPRELFDNNLDGLVSELKQIKQMIGFLSEATIGAYEPARVGTISTTDPLIFLGMAVEVAKHFGVAVTWAIGVWFSVEQIRKVRAETAQIEAFTPDEVEEIFDKKIKEQIDKSIDAKVKEILEQGNAHKKRHGELSGSLKWVLESLLAKMERGLTIELRLPPPPEETDEEDGEGSTSEAAHEYYRELVEVQGQLVFPAPSKNPVLAIPEAKDEEG